MSLGLETEEILKRISDSERSTESSIQSIIEVLKEQGKLSEKAILQQTEKGASVTLQGVGKSFEMLIDLARQQGEVNKLLATSIEGVLAGLKTNTNDNASDTSEIIGLYISDMASDIKELKNNILDIATMPQSSSSVSSLVIDQDKKDTDEITSMYVLDMADYIKSKKDTDEITSLYILDMVGYVKDIKNFLFEEEKEEEKEDVPGLLKSFLDEFKDIVHPPGSGQRVEPENKEEKKDADLIEHIDGVLSMMGMTQKPSTDKEEKKEESGFFAEMISLLVGGGLATIVSSLFGKPLLKLIDSIFGTNMAETINSFTKPLEEFQGYIQATGKWMLNFGAALATIIGDLLKFPLTIGSIIKDNILKFFGEGAEVAGASGGFVSKLVRTITGSAGGVSSALGKMIGGFIRKLPYIGALVSFGYGIKKIIDGDVTGGIFDFISGLVGFIPYVGPFLSIALDFFMASDTGKEFKATTTQVATDLYNKVGDYLMGTYFVKGLVQMGTGIKKMWDGDVWEGVKDFFQGAAGFVASPVLDAINLIGSIFTEEGETFEISETVGSLSGKFVEWLMESSFVQGVLKISDSLGLLFSGSGYLGFRSLGRSVLGKIPGFTSAMDWLADFFQNPGEEPETKKFANFKEMMGSVVKKLLKSVVNMFPGWMKGTAASILGIEGINDEEGEMPTQIQQAAKDEEERKIKEAQERIKQKYEEVKASVGAVSDAAGEMIKNASSSIGSFLNKINPFSKSEEEVVVEATTTPSTKVEPAPASEQSPVYQERINQMQTQSENEAKQQLDVSNIMNGIRESIGELSLGLNSQSQIILNSTSQAASSPMMSLPTSRSDAVSDMRGLYSNLYRRGLTP
jgi:hypothetical protein